MSVNRAGALQSNGSVVDFGDMTDGQFLKRVGSQVVTGVPAAGDVASSIASGTSTIATDTNRVVAKQFRITGTGILAIEGTGVLAVVG